MTLKAQINGQIKRATTLRESIDGETITIGGTNYTGVFSVIDDPLLPESEGRRGLEMLNGVLRIDQFLDTPASFDPANDYRADLPAINGTVTATLRGRTWFITDGRTDHDNWLIELKEKRAR